MKRIIWATLLLLMASVLIPALFLENEQPGFEAPDWEAAEEPPENGHAPAALSDAELRFTALVDGQAVSADMASFLPLVLAAEMPHTFETEALRAQAVAARTYILYCTAHENPRHPRADVCTEANCCLAYADEAGLRASWGENFQQYMQSLLEAAAFTDGQVLAFEDTPILAVFHSSSAGRTSAGAELWGDVPYLLSVDSPESANDVPNFVTWVEVTPEDFRDTALLLRPEAQFSDDASSWLGETERDVSGRVRRIIIGGAEFTGSELRRLFALRSTSFILEYRDEIFIFTVTGFGHGLGLSQYGANVMAKNGFNYREILLHYYPGTVII